jgi:hypothetical protein
MHKEAVRIQMQYSISTHSTKLALQRWVDAIADRTWSHKVVIQCH